MAKVRLDVLMVERGLAESRNMAQRLVMAGQVRVDGQVVVKPATNILPSALVEVDQGPPFVSRGGEKLEAALATFFIQPAGWVCADVGASTGGFTDCLLQNGAGKVYAIDVGQGILHWKLRQDPRVVVMERTNARFIERLPEPVRLVTIDASFISLRILLPVVKNWFGPLAVSVNGEQLGKDGSGQVVTLIKPQFEAGRAEASRGEGVIRDPAVHRRVLHTVLVSAQEEGFAVAGLIRSPLTGPKGNTEFLAWLKLGAPSDRDLDEFIIGALQER